jgi:hypothetical protein
MYAKARGSGHMRCTKCNALLQDKASFCSMCGTPVVIARVDHNTKDISISSETGTDGSSSSQAAPEAQLSSTSSAVIASEPQPPASTATTDLSTEDSATSSEPDQTTATPEQPPASAETTDLPAEDSAAQEDSTAQPESARTTATPEQLQTPADTADTPPQNSPISSEQTRVITAPRIPARPQPAKQSLDTATTYEIPKAQTHINSQQATQHEAIVWTQQISPRNTGERIIRDARIQQETPAHLPFLSPNTPSPSLPYFRLDTSNKVRYMLPAVVNPQTGMARRRKRGGLGCLLTLLVLVVIIAGGWTFVLQPFLHNLAENQLNEALSAAVNQIPAGTPLPTSSLQISETVINNLIVLNTSPSSPIQNPTTHITPANMQIAFQLYGQPCSITAVPAVQNNQLVATNVTTSGIIGLVLSPNDIATIVNQHLVAAQNRLQHSVKSVQLKDHEIDLTLG